MCLLVPEESIDDDSRECRRCPGRSSACLFSRSGDVPLGQTSRPADFRPYTGVCFGIKALAANQGLYNGFLAAGLLWGLALGASGDSIKIFFLACITLAGIFGAVTANRKILWVQAVPGAIALALVLFS